jgi:flagellin
MGMRIRTNVSSLTAQRHLETNTRKQDATYEALSSGKRINKSADDAAGLAISENLRSKVRGSAQALRNANDAVSLLQIAEGGMEEITNIMIRMRELTVQAASDTLGERERGFLNKEYVELVDEIDRITGTVEFNGNKLLNNEDLENLVIQVGANDSTNGDGVNFDSITIDLSGLKFNSESLEFGKESEIGAITGGDSPDRESIIGKLSSIDNALNRMAGERATLGAKTSRLQSTINNLGISIEGMETARSRIQDVDFASATSELTQSRILSQSTTSVLAQANQKPEMALQLLR